MILFKRIASCLVYLPNCFKTSAKFTYVLPNSLTQVSKRQFNSTNFNNPQSEEELQVVLNKRMQKLRMDIEFQSAQIVENSCFQIYPFFVEHGSPEETTTIGKIILEYSEQVREENKRQIADIMSIYGHLSCAFGSLKRGNLNEAEDFVAYVEENYSYVQNKLDESQNFMICCQLISILTCIEKEYRCSKALNLICEKISKSMSDQSLLDDKQLEEGYKSIFFYIQALIKKNKSSELESFLTQNNFLDQKWINNNCSTTPIALLPPPLLLYTLSQYFQKIDSKDMAFSYLALAADLLEQLEGEDSPNFLYLSSQLQKLR